MLYALTKNNGRRIVTHLLKGNKMNTKKQVIAVSAFILLIFLFGCNKKSEIKAAECFTDASEIQSEEHTEKAESETEISHFLTDAVSEIITSSAVAGNHQSTSVLSSSRTVSSSSPKGTVSIAVKESDSVSRTARSSSLFTKSFTKISGTIYSTAVNVTRNIMAPGPAAPSTTAARHSQSAPAKAETEIVRKSDPPETITVKVTVLCSEAIKYGISGQPENGIIADIDLTLPKNTSALTALKSALSKKNISLDESRGYIRGINGLYEKQCGGTSGWMYSVNGTYPMISSDKYILSGGDKLEFVFKTEYTV